MSERQQSPLCSLAPELIQDIAEELTIDAVKDLRLTCKKFGELLNLRIVRKLTISFSQASFEDNLSKVRILATTDCHAASIGTRTLKIASLSPVYNPDYRPVSRRTPDGWIQEPESEDPPEAMAAEEELKGYLFKAIASLKNVQSVEWRPFSKDGDWAQKDVMNALKTLPNLRVLRLYTTYFRFPLPLYDLSSIQEISIRDIRENYSVAILDNVAKLVARSPNITSIDIHSYYNSTDKIPNLHQIFKHYPQGFSPLRLRHLSLNACLVKLDNITLPHLQHLTSLSLMQFQDPYSGRSRWGTWAEPSKDTYGSSLDDIWGVLKTSRIYLEELGLDVVVPSLLEYLASYSGLKKLHLIAGGFDTGSTSDSMARKFFSAPLINHAQSLEDLQIFALYEGSWCFGPWNQAIVSRCTKLTALKMAIVSKQMPSLPSLKLANGVESVVKILIDTVSSSMPRLDSLVIVPANLNSLRRAKCGSPAMHHFSRTTLNLLWSVKSYKAPSSCHRLPHLTVDGFRRTFIPIRSDEDGRLRYLATCPPSQDDDSG